MVDLLLNVQVRKLDGSVTYGRDAFANKIVGLYFSAHWCAEDHDFSQKLKHFYENVDRSKFEIVFLSSDQDEQHLLMCMQKCQGDWYFVNHKERAIKTATLRHEVTTIPTLVIYGRNHRMITKYGREDILRDLSNPSVVLEKWINAER